MFITMFSDFVSQKYQQPQKKLKIKKISPKKLSSYALLLLSLFTPNFLREDSH